MVEQGLAQQSQQGHYLWPVLALLEWESVVPELVLRSQPVS
jgi:hypothetical protein